MGLFDFFEGASAGASAADPGNAFSTWFDQAFPGAFSVIYGSSLTSIMPAGQQTHIYGDSIQYTVDWEGILVDGLLGKWEAAAHFMEGTAGGLTLAGALGAGGYVNFVYGRNVGAVYGTTTNVQRGPSTSITGKSWLFGGSTPTAAASFSAAPAAADLKKQADLDKWVDLVTTILSACMILVGVICEVLSTTVFKPPTKTVTVATTDGGTVDETVPEDEYKNAEGEEEEPSPAEGLNQTMKSLSIFATGRFMGFIIAAEKFGQAGRDAIYKIPSAEDQLAIAKSQVAALQVDVPALDTDLKKRIKAAADTAEQAAKDIKQAVEDLTAVVAGVSGKADTAQETADAANTAANRTFLEVGSYEVGADGPITFRSTANITAQATEDGGTIIMDAQETASLRSGAASLVVQGSPGPSVVASGGSTGNVQLLAGEMDLGSNVNVQPEETSLQVGVPEEGANITMTPESITLSVGVPGAGASITLSPESITIKVGETTLSLSPEGINELVAEVTRELNAEGHNFTAAETELNVGVAGLTSSVPLETKEVEATGETNETLENKSVDATSTQEITLTELL